MLSRSSFRSISTTSDPLKFSPCWINEAIVPAARVLPPPMYPNFIRAMPHSLPKKKEINRDADEPTVGTLSGEQVTDLSAKREPHHRSRLAPPIETNPR